jgi:hypothetical protein
VNSGILNIFSDIKKTTLKMKAFPILALALVAIVARAAASHHLDEDFIQDKEEVEGRKLRMF